MAHRFLAISNALLLTILLSPIAQAQTLPTTQPMKPNLKWPDLPSYESEIKEPGVLLQSDHLLLFAPKTKAKEANVIFKILVKAYDELYRTVGMHTKYKIVVYHLPKGWGGTGECVIEYDYSNLDFDKFDEWKKHKTPHVSGYVEEMAHNFVGTTRCQFGWEMVGWSLGVRTTTRVAPNAIFARSVQSTRQEQAKTFARYKELKNTFPPDLEGNLVDRIHAHILWQCEQRYGPNFWQDFFKEILKEQKPLADAVHEKGDDGIRNARYRITIDCFNRLAKLKFKELLEQNGISATVDVKSLHPTDASWDRKLVPPGG